MTDDDEFWDDFLEFEDCLLDMQAAMLEKMVRDTDREMMSLSVEFKKPADPYTYREWLTYPQCLN